MKNPSEEIKRQNITNLNSSLQARRNTTKGRTRTSKRSYAQPTFSSNEKALDASPSKADLSKFGTSTKASTFIKKDNSELKPTRSSQITPLSAANHSGQGGTAPKTPRLQHKNPSTEVMR
jgi:hypothetical protein